nr:PilZ domain-containing protein [uncultured Holophaga sp.]
MNQKKGAKGSRETPIEDPKLIAGCLDALRDEATEFPIKVEGTSTLPYASIISAIDKERGSIALKLVRPLPHELAVGATFRMVFSVGGQRFEALTRFQGREGYLQYLFSRPTQLFYSDRRRERRFPFRPRESAYIIAQSSPLLGLGMAGPLANLSMGGLALRLDRLLRLEDQMRLPVHTGSLDAGLVLDRVRLQDLPKLPVLELRGRVAHLSAKGDEVFLGIEFGALSVEETAALAACLEFREKVSRGSGLPNSPSPKSGLQPGRTEAPAPGEEGAPDPLDEAPELEETDSPLLTLQRRTLRVGLIMLASGDREGVLGLLRHHGYLRVDTVRDLAQARALWNAQPERRPALVLAGLPPTALGVEQLVQSMGNTPMALLSDATDPGLMMGLGSTTRMLPVHPLEAEDEEHWIRILDGLAGIGG